MINVQLHFTISQSSSKTSKKLAPGSTHSTKHPKLNWYKKLLQLIPNDCHFSTDWLIIGPSPAMNSAHTTKPTCFEEKKLPFDFASFVSHLLRSGQPLIIHQSSSEHHQWISALVLHFPSRYATCLAHVIPSSRFFFAVREWSWIEPPIAVLCKHVVISRETSRFTIC